MPELSFAMGGAEASASAPEIRLHVTIDNAARSERVHAVLLHCQVRIEAAQRTYSGGEVERLSELFGDASGFQARLAPVAWARTTLSVPPFVGSVGLDLPLPCAPDLDVAATRYLDAIEHGSVPLRALFNGTVFYAAPGAGLQVAPVAWDREASWRMPIAVWREVMERHCGATARLAIRRDVLERLQRYRAGRGLPSLEHAIESLLPADCARRPEPAAVADDATGPTPRGGRA